jgi:plastocyanin
VAAAAAGAGGASADAAGAPQAESAAPSPGAIVGRVDVQRELASVEVRPGVSELGAPLATRGAPDRRRSVVYLETAPQGAFESHEGERAVLDQRDETFVPYVLAIGAGTTVDFTNSDRTYHNVFSLSKTARFDLGRYPKGRSKSVRFDHAGVVRVFCELHSHMSAFVLVFAHRFFAVTDANGRYRIDGVPPGEYGLMAWNDGEVRDSRRVRVPEQGGTVECDFVVK